MQDQEVVAAIIAGDPDGITEAYDRYAAPLYAYCSFMLPSPDDASDAVREIFLVATARVDWLSDPARLRPWLHAVARNECLRRRSTAGDTSPPPKLPRPGEGTLPAVALPTELRGQVLNACTDSSPAGRADRASAAHRAGTFGPAGFPKPAGAPGPAWRRQLRDHSRAAVAVAAVLALTATAVVVAVLTGGSHHAQAATLANGGDIALSSPGATGRTSASPSPGRQASPTAGQPTPSVTAMASSTTAPGSPAGRGTTRPSTPPSGTSPSASASASASPTASSSSSASASPTPTSTQGIPEVSPDKLVLTAASGKAVTGEFVISAAYGPVSDYSIKVPAAMAGKITVSPAKGSLADGGSVIVTVTVTSKVALDTSVTVDPDSIAVVILLSIKA